MLLFLDIDGVMVLANSWRKPEILDDGFPAFSPNATKALHRIIDSTGARIVLTTSHKSKYSPTQWRNIFSKRGISVNRINWLAENIAALNRKDELLNYFGNQDETALRADMNPFAVVVLTALMAVKRKNVGDDTLRGIKRDLYFEMKARKMPKYTRAGIYDFLKYYVSFADPNQFAMFHLS